MYKSFVKIAITGGPCGGKTSGLARISQELSDKGYEVIVVPETATLIKNSGVRIGNDYVNVEYFEKMVLRMQLFNEELYEMYAKSLPNNKDVVMVCDRGIVDCKAYIEEEAYRRLLKEEKCNEVEIRDSYDAVFHLKTVADGKEEYYTCENNMARTETAAEARMQDLKTINAWVGHPHFRVIDNSTDFDGKMSKLMLEIYSFLGIPVPLETERKYLVSMPDIKYILEKYNAVRSDIMQVYLATSNENEEVRIRQRGSNGSFSYYLTKKIKLNETSRYEIEEKITKDKYLSLLMEADSNLNVIRKTRYCFVYKSQYFELDVYPFENEKAILEIELTNENQEVCIPPFISVISEVTENDQFKNKNIAKNRNVFNVM